MKVEEVRRKVKDKSEALEKAEYIYGNYDPQKLLKDIKRPVNVSAQAAA
ncbi:hypothetical protein [Hungatella hathewayi]